MSAIDSYAAAASELVSIRDALRFAVSRFHGAALSFGHGFPDARTEAAYLVAWVLDLPHASFDEHLDARLTRQEMAEVIALVRRRVEERKPAPYLTREAWLGDFRFYVDERVLIPRSFISELLLQALAPWVGEPESVRRALDLCTGSGCLAILLAEAFPRAAVDAADLSEAALEVARRNVEDYGLEGRVRLVQSDLMTALGDVQYDVIVSNPPYVDAAAMAALPPEYRHEPVLALEGGTDGLTLVHELLTQARAHLAPGGLLVVEIGHQRETLERAYPDVAFTWLETHAGDEFVFLLRREELPG